LPHFPLPASSAAAPALVPEPQSQSRKSENKELKFAFHEKSSDFEIWSLFRLFQMQARCWRHR
jgi:hypothetical protein